MASIKNKLKDLATKKSKLSQVSEEKIERMKKVAQAAQKVSQDIKNERASQNR